MDIKNASTPRAAPSHAITPQEDARASVALGVSVGLGVCMGDDVSDASKEFSSLQCGGH